MIVRLLVVNSFDIEKILIRLNGWSINHEEQANVITGRLFGINYTHISYLEAYIDAIKLTDVFPLHEIHKVFPLNRLLLIFHSISNIQIIYFSSHIYPINLVIFYSRVRHVRNCTCGKKRVRRGQMLVPMIERHLTIFIHLVFLRIKKLLHIM